MSKPRTGIDYAKLQQTRLDKGYAQAELARKANMSAQQLANIESGRRTDPRASTVQRLATALGVTMEELMRPQAQTLRKG